MLDISKATDAPSSLAVEMPAMAATPVMGALDSVGFDEPDDNQADEALAAQDGDPIITADVVAMGQSQSKSKSNDVTNVITAAVSANKAAADEENEE